MLEHLIFDKKCVILIRTEEQWRLFISLCEADGISIYNYDAFEDGWRIFGVSTSFGKEVCGWGAGKAEKYTQIEFDDLLVKLGWSKSEPNFEIDFGIL